MLVTEGYLRSVIRRVILEKFSVVLPDTVRTGGTRPDKAWRRKTYRFPEDGKCPTGYELNDAGKKCYLIGAHDEEEVLDDPDPGVDVPDSDYSGSSVSVCDVPWSLADCEAGDNPECEDEDPCFGMYDGNNETCIIVTGEEEYEDQRISDCNPMDTNL